MANAQTEKKKILIFINLIVSGTLTLMLATATTTALPDIIAYFGTDVQTGQWVTGGYSLALGVSMPLTAYLISRFPAKNLYISGIVTFMAGVILSIAAADFTVLMIGRVLQACGSAVLFTVSHVMILSLYPQKSRGMMMGIYGAAAAAAPSVSPALAGFLTMVFGWKSIFYVCLGVMMILLLMTFLAFEEGAKRDPRSFDAASFVLSAAGFGSLTYGIGNISIYGIFHISTIMPLVAGIVGCALFFIRQLQIKKPFLDVRIFQNRKYSVSVASSMILYFVMMGSTVILPLYVQDISGFDTVASGLVILPGGAAAALASLICGKIYDNVGIRKIFIFCGFCLFVGNAGMCFVKADTPLFAASVLNFIRNICIGGLLMPLYTWGITAVEKNKAADATSLLSSLRTIAGAIGSVTFMGIMTAAGRAAVGCCGDDAAIIGVNAAFAVMAAASLILAALGLFFIRRCTGTVVRSQGR